jgi:hypothetical protein
VVVHHEHNIGPSEYIQYANIRQLGNKLFKKKNIKLLYEHIWSRHSIFHVSIREAAQAVSRRPPTEAARVRVQVRSCGICGGRSGTGTGFLRVLRFPLSIIPPSAPHSSSTIWGWYNTPNSGHRTKCTQPHPNFSSYNFLYLKTSVQINSSGRTLQQSGCHSSFVTRTL